MDILILGGTGAMGTPVVNMLSKNDENKVYVTSRSKKYDTENIFYIQGNAKDFDFIESIMKRTYDVIIDFLVYETEEFSRRISFILDHTKQYFFISSSRCYAEVNMPIVEDCERLLDVCLDMNYLKTDEYALAKCREEDLLRNSGRKNWTIIRPYITYNSYRFQLGVYEKEHWLRRVLQGKTIIFPRDIGEKMTTLTYGTDVAVNLVQLIGNDKAFCDTFQIMTDEFHSWNEILEYYKKIIAERTGIKVKVKYIDSSEDLQRIWNKWQIKYDRLYNRVFDNTKLNFIVEPYEYKSLYNGLDECLTGFLKNPQWGERDWRYEAWSDHLAGEFTRLSEIKGVRMKIRYLRWRFFDV